MCVCTIISVTNHGPKRKYIVILYENTTNSKKKEHNQKVNIVLKKILQ